MNLPNLGRFDHPTFIGESHAVQLADRGLEDTHTLVYIFGEDDEDWFQVDRFSSYWLDELIDKLVEARNYMRKHYHKDKKEGGGCSRHKR